MQTKYSMKQSDIDSIMEYFDQNQLDPLGIPLFSMYYDYLKNTRHPSPLETARLLCQSLTKHAFRLTTMSFNLTDGMGDYVSHLHFIKRFRDILSGLVNIQMQHFSMIFQDQMHSAEWIMKTRMPDCKYSVIPFNAETCHMEADRILLIEYGLVNAGDKTMFKGLGNDIKPELSHFLNSSDLTLNFSVPFTIPMDMIRACPQFKAIF